MTTLFGGEGCIKCRAIKQKLDKNNVSYDFVDCFKLEPEQLDRLGIKNIPTIQNVRGEMVYVGDFNEKKLMDVVL